MLNTRTNTVIKRYEEIKLQLVKLSKWMPILLCLFAFSCYGIYLLQNLTYVLSYASEYLQYEYQLQAVQLLYFFGRIGLIIYAIVESIILIGYLKIGSITFREFRYFIIMVIFTNLIAYVIITYVYGNVTSILGE